MKAKDVGPILESVERIIAGMDNPAEGADGRTYISCYFGDKARERFVKLAAFLRELDVRAGKDA